MSPSVSAAASSIVSFGDSSSSVIDAVPVPSANVAPDAALNCTVNVSVASAMSSCSVSTGIVFVISPGSKLSVPSADV